MNWDEGDRPFSAGNMADINAGALTVDFNLTRSAIVELNYGQQLERALAKEKVGDTIRNTFASVPDNVKQFLAVRAHEQDHMRRFISTSFGFLCDGIRNLWITLAGHLISEMGESSVSKFLPLPIQPLEQFTTPGEFLDSLSRESREKSHFATLFRGLWHLLDALIDDVPAPEFLSALWGLTDGNREYLSQLLPGIDFTRSGCSAAPLSDRLGTYRGLTARHLLELFAIGEQSNAYLRTGSDLKEIVKLLEGSEYEYAIALLAWRSVFPETNWPEVSTQPKHESDLIIDWYRLFPFELFIAADLALWPPYEPNGDLTLDREMRWSDIQPGWRFSQILMALRDLGIQPSVIPAIDRNEQFWEIQSKICTHLRWTTPDTLAGRWLAHLKALQVTNDSPWKNLEGRSSFRVPNAIKLLEARLRCPADLVLNNLSFPGLKIEGAPGWLFAEENGNRTVVSLGENGEHALIPLMVYEGVRHLTQPSRPVFRKNFDSKFRRDAVVILATHLQTACEWDDVLTRRFYEEAMRYFRIA